MTAKPDVTAPPRDYRLLVPRDWFRVDLTQDRWRAQLKTFVDHQAEGRNVPAELKQETWATLRNTAEAAVRAGALEFFLRPELEGGGILPASLLVSLVPRRGGPAPRELENALAAERRGNASATEVSTVVLPAGETVRVLGPTTLDLYVRMPGDVGYLVLAFAVPLSGVTGPMGRLCDSIAQSLRWIT
ncbi:hypothetical protein [Streptomyces humi]|uniref:hypothetical protein n=1 Tax=Streptomyces humi TaxID=1428620 RepID=UPI0006287604|nr:hypothetical protein [Streptomyces humi]